MNERIKELMEQVGIEFTYDPTETPMRAFVECWEDELVKLAELIVRECALVAKTLPHTPERHWVTDSVTHMPVHCEQNILIHFGLKRKNPARQGFQYRKP